MALALWYALLLGRGALGCPFCSGVLDTASDRIAASDIALIARLLPEGPQGPTTRSRQYEVEAVLKGAAHYRAGDKFFAPYLGRGEVGTRYFVLGAVLIEQGKRDIFWDAPVAVSDRAAAHLQKLSELPPSGADRLAYFQELLNDPDEFLSRDAYDEFGKAPYDDVKALRPRMHREKLRAWVQDPQVPDERRRLFFTLLGVCGNEEDAALLQQLITRKTEGPNRALDAAIACYLTLRGAEGLQFVEEHFLRPDADLSMVYPAVVAIRFHGDQEQLLDRVRLAASLRRVLDKPDAADIVLPDLARWEDWSVVDRVAELFRKVPPEHSYVRVSIARYLLACPLPQAEAHLRELAKLDPQAIRRAELGLPFARPAASDGASSRPAAQPPRGGSSSPKGGEASSDGSGASSSPDASGNAAAPREAAETARDDIPPPPRTSSDAPTRPAGGSLSPPAPATSAEASDAAPQAPPDAAAPTPQPAAGSSAATSAATPPPADSVPHYSIRLAGLVVAGFIAVLAALLIGVFWGFRPRADVS
jgi:hypothetical protein